MRNLKTTFSNPLAIFSVIAVTALVAAALATGMPAAAQSAPPAVTGLTVAGSADPGELDVSWDAHPGGTKDYRVSWAPNGENFRGWADTDWNAYPTGTSQAITGLQGGATYKVWVRARFDSGPSSGWSSVVTGQAASDPEPASDPDATPSGAVVLGTSRPRMR